MVGGKIKTSIVIDEDLWKKFREKITLERGLRELSKAVEEAIEEELIEEIVLRGLEEELGEITRYTSIEPIKPRVRTRAEEVVREMRESRL